MLFPLFCMFDDYWRIHCQSQDSVGKRTVKIQYFWRPAILGKYPEVPISLEDGSSQKERARWATRGPHHLVARASPRPRRLVVWPSWPTSAIAHSRISSPQKPKTRRRIAERLHRLCGAENTHREKSLRQAEIYVYSQHTIFTLFVWNPTSEFIRRPLHPIRSPSSRTFSELTLITLCRLLFHMCH
jgi:hypothetical protein